MKIIILTTLLLLTAVNADEIQRIESIVNDISQIKKDYKLLEKEKKRYLQDLQASQIENANLKSDLELYSNFTKKEKMYKNRIISLENQLNSLKKEIKTKELNKSENEIIVEKCLSSQSNEQINKFPKLQMKDEYKESEESDIIYFRASAFRVNKKATIYDAVDGQKIDEWEKLRSFTSNQRVENWIKITGYFVNKLWQPSENEMWIHSNDVIVRKDVEQ